MISYSCRRWGYGGAAPLLAQTREGLASTTLLQEQHAMVAPSDHKMGIQVMYLPGQAAI